MGCASATVVGGIGSFAGLFPLFVQELSDWLNIEPDRGLFLVFSLLYFVLPLVGYLVWLRLSNRVIKRSAFRMASSMGESKLYLPIFKYVTLRYFWVIVLFICATSAYLFFTINFGDESSNRGVIGYSLILWFPALTAATYVLVRSPIRNMKDYFPLRWIMDEVADIERKRRGLVTWVTFLTLGVWVLFVYAFEQKRSHRKIETTKTVQNLFSLDFGDVTTKQDTVSWFGYTANRAWGSDKNSKSAYADLVMVDCIRNELGQLEGKLQNKVDRFFIKSNFEYSAVKHVKDIGKLKLTQEHLIDEQIGFLNRMVLETIEEGGGQRGNKVDKACQVSHFPDYNFYEQLSVSKGSGFVDMMVNVDKAIHTLTEHGGDYVLIGGHNSCFASEQSAAVANLNNSAELRDWVNSYYLPYCQRKALDEIQKVIDKTAWIWEDMRFRGISILGAAILILVLYLIEVNALKEFELLLTKAHSRSERDGSEQESKKIIKKTDHLIYPTTITLATLFMLIAPLSRNIEVTGLSPGQPFWLQNVPRIQLTEIASKLMEPGKSRSGSCDDCANSPTGGMVINIDGLELRTVSKTIDSSNWWFQFNYENNLASDIREIRLKLESCCAVVPGDTTTGGLALKNTVDSLVGAVAQNDQELQLKGDSILSNTLEGVQRDSAIAKVTREVDVINGRFKE